MAVAAYLIPSAGMVRAYRTGFNRAVRSASKAS